MTSRYASSMEDTRVPQTQRLPYEPASGGNAKRGLRLPLDDSIMYSIEFPKENASGSEDDDDIEMDDDEFEGDFERERTVSLTESNKARNEATAEQRRMERIQRPAPPTPPPSPQQFNQPFPSPHLSCYKPVCGFMTMKQCEAKLNARRGACTLEPPDARARCFLHGKRETAEELRLGSSNAFNIVDWDGKTEVGKRLAATNYMQWLA